MKKKELQSKGKKRIESDDSFETSRGRVTEFNIDLNTSRLRSMTPDELEGYLREQIKRLNR